MSDGVMAVRSGTIVVYTAITRGYDRLKRQPTDAIAGADLVAFLDEPPPPGSPWRGAPIHTGFSDPARNAKIHKILAHRYFPDARYSLWLDGSATILFPYSIARLIDLHLDGCDLAVLQQRTRNCVYQEADVCLRSRRDDPEVIWRQILRYTRESYPANAGLAECTIVLRRHTPAVEAFNEAWWGEIAGGSRRDQLSFPYAASATGTRYRVIPNALDETPWFGRLRATGGTRLFHRAVHATPLSLRFRPLLTGRIGRRARRLWTFACQSARELGHPRVRPGALLAPRVEATPSPVATAPGDPLAASRPLPAPGARRLVVAMGPMRDVPSWSWVGFDTARELGRYYDVVCFDTWRRVPSSDVVIAVKERPPRWVVADIRAKAGKLVYVPLDVHRDPAHLAGDADLLRACDLVLAHSERLLELVRQHGARAHFVEHHARFALPEMADYKATGYVLWVGGCQYVPYLLRWLEEHPVGPEVRILTDLQNDRALVAARRAAAAVGVPLVVRGGMVAGHPVALWSEVRQAEMMRECKAALDVKLTRDFNQYLKPPTKAQQMVASGIPFAINPESYSAEYFRRRGFELASPLDSDRWLSHEYWTATRQCGEDLRSRISLRAVGARYRELIDTLWG